MDGSIGLGAAEGVKLHLLSGKGTGSQRSFAAGESRQLACRTRIKTDKQ